MTPSALAVWMNGERVGEWSRSRSGVALLRYDPGWAASEAGRPLSLSLPFTADLAVRGPAVDHYFDNLLPDSPHIRQRLRRRFRTGTDDPLALLAAIGRDCVGAVQLLPPDALPDGWQRVEAERLSDADVAAVLNGVTAEPVPGDEAPDDFRISIAGAQEKTALLRMAGRWHRPRGATPTTHILKLPLGLIGNLRADMTHSVENEWLCARLLAAAGIPMAETEMARFGDARALVVTRFDRRWMGVPTAATNKARFTPPAGAWIARLPQEDLCQALGVPPDRKYQADGGPSANDAVQVLSASARAADDLATFALAQFAFWLLAATDGHAKNFSIRHLRGGQFHLTPLYDVLSAWPIIGDGPNRVAYARARLAMGLKGRQVHYRLRDLQPRHWRTLADRCGPAAWPRLVALAEGVDAVLAEVGGALPEGFPARVWDPVAHGMRQHAAAFLAALGRPGAPG